MESSRRDEKKGASAELLRRPRESAPSANDRARARSEARKVAVNRVINHAAVRWRVKKFIFPDRARVMLIQIRQSRERPALFQREIRA